MGTELAIVRYCHKEEICLRGSSFAGARGRKSRIPEKVLTVWLMKREFFSSRKTEEKERV
jgi:hypothetical protein